MRWCILKIKRREASLMFHSKIRMTVFSASAAITMKENDKKPLPLDTLYVAACNGPYLQPMKIAIYSVFSPQRDLCSRCKTFQIQFVRFRNIWLGRKPGIKDSSDSNSVTDWLINARQIASLFHSTHLYSSDGIICLHTL